MWSSGTSHTGHSVDGSFEAGRTLVAHENAPPTWAHWKYCMWKQMCYDPGHPVARSAHSSLLNIHCLIVSIHVSMHISIHVSIHVSMHMRRSIHDVLQGKTTAIGCHFCSQQCLFYCRGLQLYSGLPNRCVGICSTCRVFAQEDPMTGVHITHKTT